MRTFVLVVIVGGVILACYLGWVKFTTGSGDGKSNVTVTVDKDKFNQDTQKAKDKVQDLGDQVKAKVEPATQGSQN